MIEKEKIILKKEKVIIVGTIQSKLNDLQVNEHLKELELLVNTAGVIVAGKVIQRISKINSATFIGGCHAVFYFRRTSSRWLCAACRWSQSTIGQNGGQCRRLGKKISGSF